MKKTIIFMILIAAILTFSACTTNLPDIEGEPKPTLAEQCVDLGGTWIADANECEYISKESCEELGGNFNECASACRNDPNAQVCTLQCVLVCEFESKPEIPELCTSWFDGCNNCMVENGEIGACTRKYCAPGAMQEPGCREYKQEIPKNCKSWYDGCNTCSVEDKKLMACTERACNPDELEVPRCLEYNIDIPDNCISWYDGCNTCGVEKGELTLCTLRACQIDTIEEPRCLEYKA